MYGFDAKTLEQFITTPPVRTTPFGSMRESVTNDHYTMRQLNFSTGGVLQKHQHKLPVVVYLESGKLTVDADGQRLTLAAGQLITISPGIAIGITALQVSVAYLFIFPAVSGGPTRKQKSLSSGVLLTVGEPTDRREKYWGNICTITSGEIAGKRLLLKAGKSGSLEFHVKKHESYFVHSGELALLLRAGRAEDRMFRLPTGTSVTLPPGLMHQRGAITDTVVFEISTADDDADSFLVEDGTKTPMPGFQDLFKKST